MDATPIGVVSLAQIEQQRKSFTQGSRQAQQPWAAFCNHFAVGFSNPQLNSNKQRQPAESHRLELLKCGRILSEL
jgi:hypothetical protein